MIILVEIARKVLEDGISTNFEKLPGLADFSSKINFMA